jgi:hypothetical protein
VDTFAVVLPWFIGFTRPRSAGIRRAIQQQEPWLVSTTRQRTAPLPSADEPALARHQRQTPDLARSLFGSPFGG